MKTKSENKKPKSIKRIATAVLAVAFIYVVVTFTTSPQKADYLVQTPDYGDDKLIALTFDDGPGKNTERLLDALEKNNAKATFFLLGKKVSKNGETVKRMYESGHLIGNHTYNHDSLFSISVKDFNAQLEHTDDEIEKITGERTRFFRPPHGFYTGMQLNRINKIAILWKYDPADWKHEDEDYVYNYVINHAVDGSIILLHDTRETTVNGVIRAIEELTGNGGYRFVRVDELLCRNGTSLKNGLAYRWCNENGKPFYF